MEELLASLRAAGDPTRLRLLVLCGQGEWTVSELTQSLSSSQPLVSRHLKQLCDAGLVERRPEGSWVFYRLRRDGRVGQLARRLLDTVPADDSRLRRDNERLAAIRKARADAASSISAPMPRAGTRSAPSMPARRRSRRRCCGCCRRRRSARCSTSAPGRDASSSCSASAACGGSASTCRARCSRWRAPT